MMAMPGFNPFIAVVASDSIRQNNPAGLAVSVVIRINDKVKVFHHRIFREPDEGEKIHVKVQGEIPVAVIRGLMHRAYLAKAVI